MFFIKLISRLPLPLLYAISDFFYLIICYVIRYRRRIILRNIERSFPEKSKAEINQIKKEFYRNLTDVFLESLKGLTISEKELKKRVRIFNINMVNTPFYEGKSTIVLTSHLYNWEWALLACSLQMEPPADAVYQKLENPFFNNLMLSIRSRFGALMIEKNEIFSIIRQRHNVPRVIALVADQTPTNVKNRYWTNFLHQETVFFDGAERIARITNYQVLYLFMKKVKRGFYEIEFKPIAQPPYSRSLTITETFVKELEKDIEKYPSSWLWSHKRWKKRKKNNIEDLKITET